MRTAIFIAGMMVADALTKGVNTNSESTTQFLAGVFILFALADILELFNKISRK